VTTKTPAIVSSTLTVVLLTLTAILSVFVEMLALNGTSERQGLTAMGVSLLCQSIGVIMLGIFAGWATRLMITRFNWNKILAVAIAVIMALVAGGLISFLSIIIAIPLAGIR
jgi:hypothetical protein